MREWPQYGDFVRTLNRWSARSELPSGLSLRLRRIGETLRVQLYANEEWQQRFALNPPKLITQSSLDTEPKEQAWRRIQPGLVQTDVALVSSERIQGAIKIGDQVLPFGPVNGLSGAEWEMNPRGPRELKAISSQSGGQDRLDLAGIWASPQQERFQGTRMWWLSLGAVLFLVEALWSRLGGQRIQFDFTHRRKPLKEKKVPSPKAEIAKHPPSEPKTRSSFSRAKDPRRK
jgi:hypothetical protein